MDASQKEGAIDSVAENVSAHDAKMARTVNLLILFGFIVLTIYFLWLITWGGVNKDFWDLYLKHIQVIAILPVAAAVSLFIVTLLGVTKGAIQFEAWGLKFRGASGPIIFWMICYLTIALSVKMLWNI